MNARLALASSACTVLLFSCGGGGGGGGGTPPPPANTAPSIQVPSSLSGSLSSWSYVLDTTSSTALQFAATDPDGDTLQWVVSADGQAASAGIGFASPAFGADFVVSLGSVGAPAASTLTILVEDPHGGAAALTLLVVRSGAPSISSVSPSSAFAGKPQQVEVTGTALRLGGSVTTNVRFDGVVGTDTVVDSDTKVRSTTPAGVPAGPTIVGVDHLFGNAALPDTAFTLFQFPPALAATDQRLDATVAAAHDIVLAGQVAHAVWLETGVVLHRRSIDGGATWTPAQPLSGAEAATEPHVVAVGGNVVVAWIGDGLAVRERRSLDGGLTFASSVRLDDGNAEVSRLRLCGAGSRRHAVWIAGNVAGGTARLVAAGSIDSGGTWSAQVTVDAAGTNQSEHALVTNGSVSLLVFLDERTGVGARGVYVSRSTGGTGWSTGQRLSQASVVSTEPRITVVGTRVHVAWVLAGSLFYGASFDSGASWTSAPIEIRNVVAGTVSGPAIAATPDRVVIGCVLAGTTVEVSRFAGPGALVTNVRVDAGAGANGGVEVGCSGIYVYAAFREGLVGDGSARVQVCASTDGGLTYSAAAGIGNGTAAQDEPRLAFDGARLLLGWLDSRDPQVGLYVNRTAQ
ncbi:MAG: exo-alpha-sialidase [Planctomycetes bacterium]|nr:exo-alpha-sialidase [Planctomycetota bacterium]